MTFIVIVGIISAWLALGYLGSWLALRYCIAPISPLPLDFGDYTMATLLMLLGPFNLVAVLIVLGSEHPSERPATLLRRFWGAHESKDLK